MTPTGFPRVKILRMGEAASFPAKVQEIATSVAQQVLECCAICERAARCAPHARFFGLSYVSIPGPSTASSIRTGDYKTLEPRWFQYGPAADLPSSFPQNLELTSGTRKGRSGENEVIVALRPVANKSTRERTRPVEIVNVTFRAGLGRRLRFPPSGERRRRARRRS